MYTTSTAILEALHEAGAEYLFANLGSDHSAFLETLAEATSAGHRGRFPTLITAPHEMVALCAAQGFAQLSGRAQAVLVHVECGTQQLGGAVHNCAKARTPVLILAGLSPATQEGEARGSRNEFIHWLQDTFDQRGLVRGYMRYDNEIRLGANAKQIVHRALQFACSEPKGPVYLTAAREVLEAEIKPVHIDRAEWPTIAPAALAPEDAAFVAEALARARRPLVVTSYVGRNPAAVAELSRLCNRLGVGVLEATPSQMNFPPTDPLHQGSQWNEKRQNPALAEADTILVIDSDVPWIPEINRPSDSARILHIDTDPLKIQMPLWYIHARHLYRADAALALRQVNAALDAAALDTAAVRERTAHYTRRHAQLAGELERREHAPAEGLTAEYATARIREAIGEQAIVLSEGVTNYHVIAQHVRRVRPGTLLTQGGGSLGWNGGAAVGAKLARPNELIVALTGDGSYMFSVPSTVHWMARRYRTPFLQVIYNNRGWRAPKFSALGVHPQGHASRAQPVDLGVTFDPPPDYAGIAAAAGGALALAVRTPDELEAALPRALHAVREERRCAVIDAWLPQL
ncbi:MAG TPA: thiamine pyrophosphate-requiring protein [Steroidobacteraceae bacterium]|nr:thiamine pyrophosphate-requiring protein [Steroidobacteraceae bacterium]